MRAEATSVEFIGGPFDGHVQPVDPTSDESWLIVALPVNENVMRMLNGDLPRKVSPARTIALYAKCPDSLHYGFLGSYRAADLELEHLEI
jgi:hypothetical protein